MTTKTEQRYLASLARPASRSRQTMATRKRLCLACLKIAARRNVAAARRARDGVGR